jgi:hypothetical protein
MRKRGACAPAVPGAVDLIRAVFDDLSAIEIADNNTPGWLDRPACVISDSLRVVCLGRVSSRAAHVAPDQLGGQLIMPGLFQQLASRYIIPAGGRCDGTVFDLESDGLLDTATTVHCGHRHQ